MNHERGSDRVSECIKIWAHRSARGKFIVRTQAIELEMKMNERALNQGPTNFFFAYKRVVWVLIAYKAQSIVFNMKSKLSFMTHIWFLNALSLSFAPFFLLYIFFLFSFFFFSSLTFLCFPLFSPFSCLQKSVPAYKRRLRACKHCRALRSTDWSSTMGTNFSSVGN